MGIEHSGQSLSDSKHLSVGIDCTHFAHPEVGTKSIAQSFSGTGKNL
jgi:hypothetical protein